ncbi:hypothetical protein MCOR27_011180 [Pyricularia oryzae]|uniref:Uncharacterized protein n=5 Tax=Pyricularia TaxID=48558 RepID=A0ABQ8NCU6_PYRGI|nr:uncharacterized protein MGG_09474 [Pyricularia oryzae 70-15]ELQ39239.1 hypothetical protein OOU_Y34scaffold00511g29 [Pyricularia oryzae Y34]KAH8847678.1 hypothetical protein MCOR01_001087 [Pyricularia oryzae]KAI6295012.1 hypothetical protein MCOR33_008014 [Pyricularia grisea]EHA52468.1 hypothetical protein MGG_09474 [Pyricularia oryzae 70-15]KAH9430393.1 hypothetical protein MCOR02_010098 [Pyricularia oryzae]
MKPSTPVLLLLPFAGLVQGCVRVHAYLSNTPIGNDIMSIELWDDDNFYQKCGTCSWAFASDQSRCRKECGKFTVEVWNNGRSAWVRNNGNNGLVYTMRRTNSDLEDYCCLFTDNGCRGRCSNWESCHKSQHDNCNRYACNLCDGLRYCGVRDRLLVASEDNSTAIEE